MGHKFAEIAFTESVRQVQSALGSRDGYAAMEQGEDYNSILGSREVEFIAARDSFYMASVGETGWPYVQHRGGPAGFVRVVDTHTIGFADFSGNRQYVSVGNFGRDDRVALIFMDYANRMRLKLYGRVRLIGDDDPHLLSALEVDDYQARVERGFLIRVEAFDWNCPQHITPRFTEAELEQRMASLVAENRLLKEHLATTPVAPGVLGDGPLALVISGVRELTPGIRAYELRDPEGLDLPAVEAGAHIKVPVRLADGRPDTRRYSISSNPARRDAYEIAVLRQDGGEGGSLAVHQDFEVGLRLHCELQPNSFRLHGDDRPAVLIAGGVGITPIKPMTQALKAAGWSFHLHYVGRNNRQMAYRDRLVRELGPDLSIYRTECDERLEVGKVVAAAPADAVFYVCGPVSLIDAVRQATAAHGIDREQVRSERFSAAPGDNEQPVTLELRRSRMELRVAPDKTLLDAVRDAGVETPSDCRAGTCKSCAVRVVDGTPDHRDSVLSEGERQLGGLMCLCVSRAHSPRLVLDL